MDFAQRSRDDGGLGLEPHQAAGLVGNLQNESGSSIPSWGPTGDNGSAWGSAQWRGDRLQALKDHADDNELDYRTPEAQQSFMRKEFDTTHNGAYKALQAATTPEESANVVNRQYEISADRSDKRERSARALIDGPTAIETAMGRPRSTGSTAMGFAPEDNPNGALSSAPPPGALSPNAPAPAASPKWAQILSALGDMSINMAPGIAQDPAHAQVLQAAANANKVTQGTWSTNFDPITGKATQTSSDGKGVRQFKYAEPRNDPNDKVQWGITGKDKYGQPVYGDIAKAAAALADNPAAAPGASEENQAVNLTGKDYLTSLQTADPKYASQVQSVIEGRTPYPTGMLLKTPYGQKLAQDVTQADPSFETGNAMARVKTNNEFRAGGVSSPAGQITAGNTALQHAGDMSDALEKFKGGGADYSGVPFASYYMNKLHNAGVQGTPEGASYNDFMTAKNHFSEEVTKFYAGSAGSEGERKRALANLDEAKSLPELRSAIKEETSLMQGKVNALQDRWHTSMGPMVPDFPLIQQKSQEAIDRITQRHEQSSPTASTPSTKRPPLGDIFK
jgi:hypothetical protein